LVGTWLGFEIGGKEGTYLVYIGKISTGQAGIILFKKKKRKKEKERKKEKHSE
jgi:hypothetical protein